MPDLTNLPFFPEEKKEFSIYLSWDKDFIGLANKSIQIMIYIFFLFLEENILWVLIRSTSVRSTSLRNKQNVNFQASKSWLEKWILTIYLSMDK